MMLMNYQNLLVQIDLNLYTVNGSIAFCITDIEAESEDEANELVADELQLDYRGNGSVDSWDVEISDVSEQ